MNETEHYERLRFAASNFLELQGLRQVALGFFLVFVILAMKLNEPWNIWLFALLMALLGIAWWRIGRYYEHRFGHVEPRAPSSFSWIANLPTWARLVWIVLILVYLASVWIFNAHILRAGWWLGMLFIGYFALGHRRWYYLLCALPFFVLEILNQPPRSGVLLIEIWILPCVFIITGILDHRLLVRLLPGARANGNG